MRLAKKILGKATKNFVSKINQRIKAYKKAGIDEDVINERLGKIASIEGFSVNAKGNLVADKDFTEESAVAVLLSLPKKSELIKEISAPLEAATSEAEKQERARIAQLKFQEEVRVLRRNASESLWDIWYSKHEGGWNRRYFERQDYLKKLSDVDRADLADKVAELGTLMGDDEASAEEIFDLYNEIKTKLAEVGVKL